MGRLSWGSRRWRFPRDDAAQGYPCKQGGSKQPKLYPLRHGVLYSPTPPGTITRSAHQVLCSNPGSLAIFAAIRPVVAATAIGAPSSQYLDVNTIYFYGCELAQAR